VLARQPQQLAGAHNSGALQVRGFFVVTVSKLLTNRPAANDDDGLRSAKLQAGRIYITQRDGWSTRRILLTVTVGQTVYTA
jgi:hypothetical protein